MYYAMLASAPSLHRESTDSLIILICQRPEIDRRLLHSVSNASVF